MRSSKDKNFSSSSSLRVVVSIPYLAKAEKGFKLALLFLPARSDDGGRSKGLGDIERDENIITNRFI